jgi:uncharacterized membrane protein
MKNTIVKKLIHFQGVLDGMAILLLAAFVSREVTKFKYSNKKNKKLKEQINERNINK